MRPTAHTPPSRLTKNRDVVPLLSLMGNYDYAPDGQDSLSREVLLVVSFLITLSELITHMSMIRHGKSVKLNQEIISKVKTHGIMSVMRGQK
jgi:hypothetical protein